MGGGYAPAPQPRTASRPEPDPGPQSFDQVMQLVEEKRDAVLALDLRRYVRPLEVRPGVLSFSLAEGAPANLPQRLSARLKEWTGRPWMIDVQGGGHGVETAWERQRREDAEFRANIEADPFVQAVLQTFPGAEVVGVRRIAAPAAEAGGEDAGADEDN
jgi:DNA polymerase-3 subunit gamma/tau